MARVKRSLNCSHSISKNRSSREHRVFNTNNLAILGNNIIIEGSFNHRILSMIEFREIDMISWNQGHQELYHNLFSSLHSTFCLFIWIFDAYFSLHSFSNLKIHSLLEMILQYQSLYQIKTLMKYYNVKSWDNAIL